MMHHNISIASQRLGLPQKAVASAQRANSVEISGFGGGYFGSTIYSGPLPASPVAGPITTVGLNSSGMWGARLGLNFQRQFGVEFSWSGSNPTMNFSSAFSPRPSGSLKINNFDFDAMFNFGQQRVWGYFGIGLGWSDFAPTFTSSGGNIVPTSSQSYFSINTALGLKAFINPHLAFRAEWRYRWSETNHTTSAGTGCYYYCYAYSSNWYGASELTGGLTYAAFK